MTRIAISGALILFVGLMSGPAVRAQTKKGTLNAAEQAEALAAVRKYATSYTKSLPNYTCTQTTRQMFQPEYNALIVPTGAPSRLDVIEEQLSFVDGSERRSVTKINDRPATPAGRDQLMGTFSRGEFRGFLGTIFDPVTGADVQWSRTASFDGRRLNVFSFHVPQPSGYVLTEAKRTIRVPFEGLVYADPRTGAVLRIEMKCTGIPRDSEYLAADLALDYKAAQLAGQEFLLPSNFSLHYRMRMDRVRQIDVKSFARYSSYHRFSADTSIQFEDEAR